MTRAASINLLPTSCLDARVRARRQWRWSVTAVGLGAVLCAGWVVHLGGESARNELLQNLAVLQARQTELDLQLTRASRGRASFYDQARALAQLRPGNAVPEQLLELARRTPDGVFLTEMRAQPFASAKPSPRPTTAPAAPGAAPAAGAIAAAPPRSTRVLQIAGIAMDFERVQTLVDALTDVPQWERVELVRWMREKRDGHDAVAFRIECQDREGGP